MKRAVCGLRHGGGGGGGVWKGKDSNWKRERLKMSFNCWLI